VSSQFQALKKHHYSATEQGQAKTWPDYHHVQHEHARVRFYRPQKRKAYRLQYSKQLAPLNRSILKKKKIMTRPLICFSDHTHYFSKYNKQLQGHQTRCYPSPAD
jgi:hypothetical protein